MLDILTPQLNPGNLGNLPKDEEDDDRGVNDPMEP